MHPYPHHNPRCKSCGAELPALLHAEFCADCWRKLTAPAFGPKLPPLAAALAGVRRAWRNLRRYFACRRPPGVN